MSRFGQRDLSKSVLKSFKRTSSLLVLSVSLNSTFVGLRMRSSAGDMSCFGLEPRTERESCRVRIGPGSRQCASPIPSADSSRSEEHTSELQSRQYLVCRLLLEKKK